ncbi:MAG: BBP7 family outer membrane beta-barrel protein [Pirellulaceae bacterium]
MLTITALVIAVHEAQAQSNPYAGAPPMVGDYPGAPTQMQPGMAGPAVGTPGLAPQYYSGSAMGAPNGAMAYAPTDYSPQAPAGYPPQTQYGYAPQTPAGYAPQTPYGYQPVAYPSPYYDPSQGAAPQQLAPSPAAPMGDAMGGPVSGGEAYGEMGAAGCNACGGYGCEQCMGACDDFDLRLLRWLLPYGAGGCGAQRWYDVSAEWVSLRRDQIGDPTVFTTDGINGVPVLGTDNLGFENTSGARVSFAIQLGAGNNIETNLMGGFNWASSGVATSDNDNLYSIMSDYGLHPFNGYDQTDQSYLQTLAYSSELNTVDLNYRQRWAGPNVRVQGSWLVGVRYFELTEDLRYMTFTSAAARPNGSMDYLVGTSNALTGAQLGGDLWVCITPGVQIGSEVKMGLYGNHASQRTTIDATDPFPGPLNEKLTKNAAAFMGDANITLLWRVSQNWTFRAGYAFVWADGVALATDNFNPGQPETSTYLGEHRTPFIDTNGDVFYHGATLGLEYLW